MADARLAVVPARGGSKRVRGKNLRLLAGRPLLAHVVAAAVGSGLFERVVVSTDDPRIAEAALEHGAEVPFVRPADLADDVTPVSAATLDALERVDPDGTKYAEVCQLMANCPLVRAQDVRASHDQFAASGAEVQMSVVRYGWQNPWWALTRDSDLRIEPLFPRALQQRSQDLPELFCPTGAVWWVRAAALRRAGTFHMAGRTGWEMPWERGVDVDTEDDLVFVAMLHKILEERALRSADEGRAPETG